MGGKNKRAKFADEIDASVGGEVQRVRPSHIRADHADNQRLMPYDTPAELVPYLVNAKCCFKLSTIERRLKSLLAEGQVEPIQISISGTGQADLEIGYLRHAAFCLAEARGIIDKIPRAKGKKKRGNDWVAFSGMRAEVVSTPKSQADQEAKARRNRVENREREGLSPVDTAIYFRRRLDAIRDSGPSVTKQELADEEDKSMDYVNKHLRLLTTLKPAELLEVHEGTLKMTEALRNASKEGRANNPGPRGARAGVAHGTARKRLAVIDSTALPKSITPRDIMLAGLMAGSIDASDKSVPEDLRALVAVLQVAPPKPPRASTPRKKAATNAAPH